MNLVSIPKAILKGILSLALYLPIRKILFLIIIVLQTLMCLLLVFLVLLQKGDDGGIGQVFMRTSILYNKSENIFVRKIIVFIATFVIGSCLFLSVYFYRENRAKYAIENLLEKREKSYASIEPITKKEKNNKESQEKSK